MPASSPAADRQPPADVLTLPVHAVPTSCDFRLRLTVRLVGTRPSPASLWVRPVALAVAASELLAALAPDTADGFELMAVTRPRLLTLVRATRSDLPAPWSGGFVESAVRNLYLPVGRRLGPAVPPLRLPCGYLSWLTEDAGLTKHTAPIAFRPLAECWAVVAPSVRLFQSVATASPFVFSHPQVSAPPRTAANVSPLPPPAPTAKVRVEPRQRSWTKLTRLVHVSSVTPLPPAASDPPSDLRALEGRLLAITTTPGEVERPGLWAELAAGYRARGRTADAAVCWVNAVWCHPVPAPDWPWRQSLATREADRPVRAVWLDRLAQYERDGDRLAVARCRDRLLARLAAGLEPDLDLPSFLRRTERRLDPVAVRVWLDAVGGPVRKWLAGCTAGTKLTAAGLDADRTATRCYADLTLAWGSATVGDRAAVDRATAAVADLRALRRPAGINPVVHTMLGERFLVRAQAALSGQPVGRPGPVTDRLATLDRYAVERLLAGCEALGEPTGQPLDTPAALAVSATNAARLSHRSDQLLTLLDTIDPEVAAVAAGPLFRAARALGLRDEAVGLVAALAGRQPPAGGRRDLGLAIGRYLVGDEAGGDRALGAARHRLFVTGVPDLRKRGELAVAYATAVGHAAPGVVAGRLHELFHRLGPVSAQGACGRYFALLPLRVVDAVVRAAVGDDFAPSDAVRRWLADEEWQTRRRIHEDMRKVLSDE